MDCNSAQQNPNGEVQRGGSETSEQEGMYELLCNQFYQGHQVQEMRLHKAAHKGKGNQEGIIHARYLCGTGWIPSC
jgi:hypothetical protein